MFVCGSPTFFVPLSTIQKNKRGHQNEADSIQQYKGEELVYMAAEEELNHFLNYCADHGVKKNQQVKKTFELLWEIFLFCSGSNN